MISITHGLILSAILFLVGLLGMLTRKNIIFILLSLEIMLNASGLAFVIAASRWEQPDGQVMFLFILTFAAVEVAAGLALTLLIYQKLKTLEIDTINSMKEIDL